MKEKDVGAIKARFGTYKSVIEGVKGTTADFIFIFNPKGIFYRFLTEYSFLKRVKGVSPTVGGR
ncbi:hypothetical protein SZ39_2479 [Bacillus mycoides]|uniref:hypothetical protein n=1 Tax=Bacillus mycoides TaxID=1405 RepID=UPI0005C943D6|nr:hypothetical protein [Bacillus mycoides]KIV72659.1 hypothetical protein SZ39_2479 [Bacillus mycoides]